MILIFGMAVFEMLWRDAALILLLGEELFQSIYGCQINVKKLHMISDNIENSLATFVNFKPLCQPQN